MLFGVALCGPALSAPPASPLKDRETIAQCIDKDRNAGGFGRKCIGMIADPCIQAAKDHDSYADEAKACAARELAVWLARLPQAIKVVNTSGSAKMRSAVSDAQTSWAKSRDLLCPMFNNLDPGLSLGAGDYCRLQETASRVLLLEGLGAAISEH